MPSSTSVSAVIGFPAVPEFMPNEREHRREIARKLNFVNQGKFNCVVDVTLSANTGATVITDSRIGYNSAVSPLMALSLSGATAIGAGIWFDTPLSGAGSTTATIVVHHDITSDTDKTIRFGILG